jgi:hypothetical protein
VGTSFGLAWLGALAERRPRSTCDSDDILAEYRRTALIYRRIMESSCNKKIGGIYRAQIEHSRNIGKQEDFKIVERIYAGWRHDGLRSLVLTDEIERLDVTKDGGRDLRNPNALHREGGGVCTQSR